MQEIMWNKCRSGNQALQYGIELDIAFAEEVAAANLVF